ADRCKVETRVIGCAVIGKAAEAGVYADNGCRGERVAVSQGRRAAVIFFRTTVLAKSRAERVLRQIQNVPIGIAEKDVLVVGNGMVKPPNNLVLVSTSTVRFGVIILASNKRVGSARGIGGGPKLLQIQRGGIQARCGNDVEATCSIRACRIGIGTRGEGLELRRGGIAAGAGPVGINSPA